jgi:hypothetical protein
MSGPRLRLGDLKDGANLEVLSIAALDGEHHVQLGAVVKRLRVPGRIDCDTGPSAAAPGPTHEVCRSGPGDYAHTGASPGDVRVLTSVAARVADGPRIGGPSGYAREGDSTQEYDADQWKQQFTHNNPFLSCREGTERINPLLSLGLKNIDVIHLSLFARMLGEWKDGPHEA